MTVFYLRRNLSRSCYSWLARMGRCLKCLAFTISIISLIVSLISSATLVFLFWPCEPVDPSHYTDAPLDLSVPGMKSYYFWVNNFNLYVNEAGPSEGKLVIFLHGFPETALLTFAHQIRFFANQGYHVIAPDLRGYNASFAGCNTDEDCNREKMAIDVVSLIDKYDKHSDRKIHPKGYAMVVGHDWGGATAWSVALTSPEVVEKFG